MRFRLQQTGFVVVRPLSNGCAIEGHRSQLAERVVRVTPNRILGINNHHELRIVWRAESFPRLLRLVTVFIGNGDKSVGTVTSERLTIVRVLPRGDTAKSVVSDYCPYIGAPSKRIALLDNPSISAVH